MKTANLLKEKKTESAGLFDQTHSFIGRLGIANPVNQFLTNISYSPTWVNKNIRRQIDLKVSIGLRDCN